MKPTPSSTDKNPNNTSKSGSAAAPIQGSRKWDADRGVRETKPTVIAGHNGNPQGGPEQQLKHHAAAKAGDPMHKKRPY